MSTTYEASEDRLRELLEFEGVAGLGQDEAFHPQGGLGERDTLSSQLLDEAGVVINEAQPTNDQNLREEKRTKKIHFEFNDGWMLGSGVVAPSQESRTRAVFQALQRGWPVYEGPDYLEAEKLYKRFAGHYLPSKVSVDGGQTTTTRSNILNLDTVMENLKTEYAKTNHPVAQLLEQLTSRYSDLPKAIIRDLEKRVLLAVDHDRIRTMYETAIRAAKVGHKIVRNETNS